MVSIQYIGSLTLHSAVSFRPFCPYATTVSVWTKLLKQTFSFRKHFVKKSYNLRTAYTPESPIVYTTTSMYLNVGNNGENCIASLRTLCWVIFLWHFF